MSKLSCLTEGIKKHKKLLIIGGIISVAAVCGVVVVKNINQKKEEMLALMNQPQTSTVERRTLVNSVSATGVLTGVESKDVTVNLTGLEIKSLSVEVGDMVEEGQVLCELDTTDIEEELADVRTALNVANEKTKMDNIAAERNLQDVLEDFNKDIDRGNQDLASAYEEYLESLIDVEEARKEWEEAGEEYKKNKKEYDYYKKKLSEAENKKNAVEESGEIAKKFNSKKSELMQYMEKKGIVFYNNVISTVNLGSDFKNVTAEKLISAYESSNISIGEIGNSLGSGSTQKDKNDNPGEEKEDSGDKTASDKTGEGTADVGNEIGDSGTNDEGTNGNDNEQNGGGEIKENGEGQEGANGVNQSSETQNSNSANQSSENTPEQKPTETEPTKTEPTNQESTDSEPKATEKKDTESANGDNVKTIDLGTKNEAGESSQEFAGTISDAEKKEIRKKVDGYLSELKSLNSQYENSLQIEKDYQELDLEVNKWEAEYNASEMEESSAEKAYEQAESASQAQLDTYEKMLRTMDDTQKSGENSILSKSESLYNTQLNSITSGDNEKEKIKEYKEQLEDCVVKAPISGVVSVVNVEEGDHYNGGTIVTIDDASAFEVSAQIDEYDIGKIKKGQQVIIKTNATGDEELEGTVTRIAPRATQGGSEVTYTVTISVDTPHDMLRMDMTAKLSIILESKENVMTVPYEAVQEENEKFYVEAVVEENDMQETESMKKGARTVGQKGEDEKKIPEGNLATRKIYVEKGIESDYYIEIISNEIREGMEIVVPKSDNQGGFNLQDLMQQQGPMGGF